MCVTQHAHCQIYSNTHLTSLLRKVLTQKTELIVTRYLPDEVLIEGSDKCFCLSKSTLQKADRIPHMRTWNNHQQPCVAIRCSKNLMSSTIPQCWKCLKHFIMNILRITNFVEYNFSSLKAAKLKLSFSEAVGADGWLLRVLQVHFIVSSN